MKKVELYTDGACSGNPGPGGWGAILRYGEHEKELSGGAHDTTNNRMELTAVIEGLKALKEPCMVTVYSDSKYFCDGVQKGWVYGWKKRGWKKSDGKPALNPDLWEELLTQLGRHQVEIVWVKGHAGHPENERCDRLAVAQRDKPRCSPLRKHTKIPLYLSTGYRGIISFTDRFSGRAPLRWRMPALSMVMAFTFVCA